MIKIICVGKVKEKYLQEAIKDYQKRISRYTKLEIIEVQDQGIDDYNKAMEIEAGQIEKYIDDRSYLITLEIEGDLITSVDLANKIDKTFTNYSNITFIIGGSYGISESLKTRANYHLSFSKMTFPHQLFRIILLEQIYRAFKINNNESYHK